MKKICTLYLLVVIVVIFSTVSIAEDVAQISFSDNEVIYYREREVGETEENAVKVADSDSEFVDNEEGKDSGLVQFYWNPEIYVVYGCSVATMTYENPIKSNLGVKAQIAISDKTLIENFGTTFRSEAEINDFAFQGLEVLKNGVSSYSVAYGIFKNGLLPRDYLNSRVNIPSEKLIEILVQTDFMGLTSEELSNLSEESVKNFSEIEKLELAQLGGYSFKKSYHFLGTTEIVNPGYAVYNTPLFTFENNITLPKGTYTASYIMTPYDESQGDMSDMTMVFPAIINVEKDLPKDLCEQYGITLAKSAK